MMVYKIDVLNELRKKGISSYDLLGHGDVKGLLGGSQIHKMRKGEVLGRTSSIELLCKLLDKQVGDIIEYIPDDRYKALYNSGYFEQAGIPAIPPEEAQQG